MESILKEFSTAKSWVWRKKIRELVSVSYSVCR
jgi:hypothetical protein